MILEEETYEKFDYYPSKLKPKSAKKILAKCDDCGMVRTVKKQAYHPLCKSCSQKGENNPNFGRKGKNSPLWKGGLVKRICEACGIEFEVKPSQIKDGEGRFCSCSCSKNGENHPNWKGGKIKRICPTCGKIFEVKPSMIKRGRGKFCSPSCAIEGNKGENNHAWKGGISFEPYCEKFNDEFKEYIREKFGRICFLCGKTEDENGQRLSVHHVNYNKDCGCDGDLTCQFVPLCMSCNTKVNNNREMWIEKIMSMLKITLKGWYI